MSVVVIGLNHRSAPLAVLERLAVSEDDHVKVLDALLSSSDVSEAAVLSTCNRVEVYARVERFHPAYADIREVLIRHAGLHPDDVAEHLYVHHDDEAARHLFSVTCGLESAVLGETDIVGQVRRTFDLAHDAEASGPALSDLFSASLSAGRKVRAQTGIARNITSVSRAAVAMATDHLGSLEGRSICVLGAGDMSEGMTVALRDAGAHRVHICNRTMARATALAERVGGVASDLTALPSILSEVDLLLTGTGANSLMVEHAVLADLMLRRPDKPLLIVDIAVPRDVDPAAADVPGVTLLDMDDLSRFAEAGRNERRNEIAAVRSVIDAEVDRFRASSASRLVEPLLSAFRKDVESMRLAEVDRLADSFDDESRSQLDAATRAMVNKLLHHPMAELRAAAGTTRGERLADALRELFGVDPDVEN